jgi:uncharacterized membrane protein YoaK (UPF0700 family)
LWRPALGEQFDVKPAFTLALFCLAGAVDAIGFLELNGLFVSFMSGNSTRLAVDVAAENLVGCLEAGEVIFCFVAGVCLGERVSKHSGAVVLAVDGFLLACSAVFGFRRAALAAFLALAMGLQNAALKQPDGADEASTYVTGALVKLGQDLVAAASGRPSRWRWFAAVWGALVVGGVSGGLLRSAIGERALYVAAAVAIVLAFLYRVGFADARTT